ncbi:MAG: hypothetical protein ACI8R4_000617 [Paracoccaceae bacterium]|jgi:hypothetical protein
MNKIIAFTLSGLCLLTLGSGVSAQASAALGQAKARLACGAGTVVSSTFLPNGSLQVTCSQPQTTTESTVLEGTTLTAPTAAGVLAIATVLVISTGGSGGGTTTTTTTTTSSDR